VFQAHLVAWRLDGKPLTTRRFTVYKNCPLPTPEDHLFFILTYLKTYALIKERAACYVPRSFRRYSSSRMARPSGAPRLRGHIGHRDLCLLTLIRNAGLRASEVLYIHIHSTGWTSGHLLVREGNGRGTAYCGSTMPTWSCSVPRKPGVLSQWPPLNKPLQLTR
jgi:hypothetical protein